MFSEKNQQRDNTAFLRLRMSFILALAAMIVTIIITQIIIQRQLNVLINDTNNVALITKRLLDLKQESYILCALTFLVLFLVLFFILNPLAVYVRNTISNLLESQLTLKASVKNIEIELVEKKKSLQTLQELNFVVDNAALFASARSDGSIVSISKKFLKLLGIEKLQRSKPLSEVLTSDEGQQQYLKEVLKNPQKSSIRKEEIQIKTESGAHLWLDISIIPMHQASKQQSILILCSDITERKANLLKVEQLTQQRFEERILQKKLQASQIVESQEEERKRIAKDIHDGIGQMLTALKFNIESIDLQKHQKAIEKITYIKSLTGDLIKGVRTATFNLTPPELSDHGLFPALRKMTIELARLTGNTILFKNKSETHHRFDSLVETNIYRIVQEAINNAIKYAQASYILVTINYREAMLSIVVDDDGQGFDASLLTDHRRNSSKPSSEGGMGLFFMKERISYINGRLFIHSELGKGPRVTINYKNTRQP